MDVESHRPGNLNAHLVRYTSLVHRLAHHLMTRLPANVEVDDLIQAGMIGLLDATERFEDKHGAQFETYAARRIQGAMLDELRGNDWMPRRLRKSLRDLEAAIGRLQQRLGRAPLESEIAQEIGVPLAEYQQLLGDAHGAQLIYLDELHGSGEDDLFEWQLADDGSDPLEQLIDGGLRTRLVEGIEGLPDREKLVMALLYEEDLNLRETGLTLGVSESRVCQIHTQVISRLRVHLHGKPAQRKRQAKSVSA